MKKAREINEREHRLQKRNKMKLWEDMGKVKRSRDKTKSISLNAYIEHYILSSMICLKLIYFKFGVYSVIHHFC